MTSQSVDLKYAASVFDPAKFRSAVIRGLRLAAVRGQAYILTEIIPKRVPQPVDRGGFRAMWRTRSISNGAEIFNSAPWAAFIEYGVRADRVKPGRIMILELAEWVKRKGIERDPKLAIAMAHRIVSVMRRTGIFNRQGKQGLQILRELVEKKLPEFVKEEVDRSIQKAMKKGVASPSEGGVV